ncbi:Hsp20/alpha crystallin family protein [Dictyocaulus viviparus]|uniref:Hsp20/alpha crystallin family protein n=1 Tax=Dictyocaulus viviparus TaxID=29172 RepID=A0A0D8XUR3_DICVI|nr:Hsp20/alpha crystallin family protein [Dictyocaulus viviparus]
MSLWSRPSTIFNRFFEDCRNDFREMDKWFLNPLGRALDYEFSDRFSKELVDDESKFAVSLDVSKFKPECLKVNIDGRLLTIEGKEEIKEENNYSMRSFVRQFLLPKDVNLDSVRSSLTDNGHLSIEAPKFTKPSESAGRSIPIEKV